MKALSPGSMGEKDDLLLGIFKGLNYNNRDNGEVKFLLGVRGAINAAEVFGPSGVWVYNLLLGFLKIPAGAVSLEELLDSAIQRRNAPNDKAKCLVEIAQFWEKLLKPQKQQQAVTQTQISQKSLQAMNANGDDRNLSTHGSDRSYWYI